MAEAVHVTEADFDAKVMTSAIPVVLDFWATWCGPCRMVAPLLDELARELDGKFMLAKVDVDSVPAIAEKFGIQSIPTLLFIRDGKVVRSLVGFVPKPEIKKALSEVGVA